MAAGACRFFYRKQSVDTELAAFQRTLRIGELADELKFLRLELNEDDPEAFDTTVGNEERLFYAADGCYTEIERLRKCSQLEFEKFNLMRIKKNLLMEYERLTAKQNAKNKQPNPEP